MLNDNEAKVRQVLIDLQNKVRPEEAMKVLGELQARAMMDFLKIVPLPAIRDIADTQPDGIDVLQGAYVSEMRRTSTTTIELISEILLATNKLQFPEGWPDYNNSRESLAQAAMDKLWQATWPDQLIRAIGNR